MKKRIVKTFAALVLLTFTLLTIHAQQDQNTKGVTVNGLVGTWVCNCGGQTLTLSLFNNNKGSFAGKEITYSSTASQLIITNAGSVTPYFYVLSGNNLTLSGGDFKNPAVFFKAAQNTNRLQSNADSAAAALPGKNSAAANALPVFLGNWVSDSDEHLSFTAGGKMQLEGFDLTYTFDAHTISINTSGGAVVLIYAVNGNTLTCTSNGTTTVYQKEGSANINNNNNNQIPAQEGLVDLSMVGKWCMVKNASGGYNTPDIFADSECFILEANGNYEFAAGGNSSFGSGGITTPGADRGTWTVQGNLLIARAQNGNINQYPFQKINSANSKPCLVINGVMYVTFYNKQPWQ